MLLPFVIAPAARQELPRPIRVELLFFAIVQAAPTAQRVNDEEAAPIRYRCAVPVSTFFGCLRVRCPARALASTIEDLGGGLFRSSLHHHARILPQRDPRPWPAHDRRPVSRHRNLEVIDASDLLDDAVRGAVPDIHAEGRVALGLHRCQIRLDWPAPRAIYTPCCCVA